MIQYSLKCDRDHVFDSWFQSADAFEKLRKGGMLTCATCGSDAVEKAIMAPRVNNASPKRKASGHDAIPAQHKALAALRRHVEQTSDYVGRDFVREARAIHEGDAPERPIWGEARSDEARKLAEDGIAVTPLPFIPTRKTN